MTTAVPFSLFAGAGFEPPPLRRRGRELLPAVIIALLHGTGLLSMQLMRPGSAEAASANLESVTYLDIPPPTVAESPRKLVRPATVAVSDAVIIPAAQGELTHPDKAAGFQELAVPKDLVAVPVPGDSGAPVDEKDFSGRGVVGGVAGGKPPPAIPAALAAAMAREGRLSDDLAASRLSRRIRVVDIDAVEVKPRLLNAEEVRARLLSNYPAILREAGIEGSAMVEFVVDTSGAVVAGSGEVLSSTHPLFGRAALEVMSHARFTPGRMIYEGTLSTVPVKVRAPLKWLHGR